MQASSDDVAVQAPSRSGSVAARNGNGEEGAVLSPRLVQALEDLAGKQAELEQQVRAAPGPWLLAGSLGEGVRKH